MDNVLIAFSSIADGSMSVGETAETLLERRGALLKKNGSSPNQAILVKLDYQGNDFRRYFSVSTEHAGDGIAFGSSIISDALFTRSKNLALLLPVADCIGAVLYDKSTQAIGLAHLGRHNLIQQGGTGIVEFMVNEFNVDPAYLTVWLSPAAGRQNYPLYDFDNRSLHEVAMEQLAAGGVDLDNISQDRRDTTTDLTLFSHSEFLKGNRPTDGRQAVIAMMNAV